MKRILFFIMLFIVTVAIASYYYSMQVTTSLVYQVKPGASIISIAHELRKRGVIHSSDLLIYIARLERIKPKAGYYHIHSMRKFLDDVHSGNTLKDNITLLPGKTLEEYYDQLRTKKSVEVQRSLADIISELGIKAPYEGKFLADTFTIEYGDSALSVLSRSHELYKTTLDAIWQQRSKNQYITTPYQLTILASIIEKESGNEREKRKIAGVFTNRLAKNMRLQSDPTTIYALKQLGKYNGNLTKQNLKTKSPYNTYTIKGLPIGAISNVAKSTLLAASTPEQHDYYYFVAKNKRTHVFAKTYDEHRQNIKRYITNK